MKKTKIDRAINPTWDHVNGRDVPVCTDHEGCGYWRKLDENDSTFWSDPCIDTNRYCVPMLLAQIAHMEDQIAELEAGE